MFEDPDAADGLYFDRCVVEALDSLPADLLEFMSNVEIVVEDEPPGGRPLLGLYQGVPLTRRGGSYGAVLPDKISIYRGPPQRLYGTHWDLLRDEIKGVLLHDVAHHFRISDQLLTEMYPYWYRI